MGLWLVVCATSCSSPTAPAPPGFAGEWAGTTAQGAPVSFTVAGDEVTSFRVTFNLPPACSGTETIPGPKQILTETSGRSGFVISKVHGDFEWGVAAAGEFSLDRRSVSGQINTVHYPGCGILLFKWSASRR